MKVVPGIFFPNIPPNRQFYLTLNSYKIMNFRILLCAVLMYTQGYLLQAQQGFHQFRVKNIFGDSVNLSDYAGTKLLVVNTASFCGYTHQFTKLRQLDSAYQSYGFRVIGFPCNDFGGQDPYADSTINSFCQNEYGIQFPMMAKISIVSGDTSPVYKWLQRKALNGVANVSVSWNFNKFLIDQNGNWVKHYFSPTEPNDTAITNWIMSPVTRVSGQAASYRIYKNSLHEICIETSGKAILQRVRLYSLQGRLLTEKYPGNGSAKYALSTAGLPPGSYLLEMQDENANPQIRHIQLQP